MYSVNQIHFILTISPISTYCVLNMPVWNLLSRYFRYLKQMQTVLYQGSHSLLIGLVTSSVLYFVQNRIRSVASICWRVEAKQVDSGGHHWRIRRGNSIGFDVRDWAGWLSSCCPDVRSSVRRRCWRTRRNTERLLSTAEIWLTLHIEGGDHSSARGWSVDCSNGLMRHPAGFPSDAAETSHSMRVNGGDNRTFTQLHGNYAFFVSRWWLRWTNLQMKPVDSIVTQLEKNRELSTVFMEGILRVQLHPEVTCPHRLFNFRFWGLAFFCQLEYSGTSAIIHKYTWVYAFRG